MKGWLSFSSFASRKKNNKRSSPVVLQKTGIQWQPEAFALTLFQPRAAPLIGFDLWSPPCPLVRASFSSLLGDRSSYHGKTPACAELTVSFQTWWWLVWNSSYATRTRSCVAWHGSWLDRSTASYRRAPGASPPRLSCPTWCRGWEWSRLVSSWIL